MCAELKLARLGRTGLLVSPLCFGTIPLGVSRGMAPAEASSLLRRAYEAGVNFVDTAEIYDNYEAIRLSLQGWHAPVHIATKSYAAEAAGMRASLDRARRALGRDRIDLFLLHEMESAATLRGHRAALDCLLEARARGTVGAVGISTHTIAGVRAACALPELDVIHPLINRRGIGIRDGSAAEMAEAIAAASQLDLGIYAMKVLAGGHLRAEAAGAITYARALPGVASIAIGIQNEQELQADLAYCSGTVPSRAVLRSLGGQPRRLFVEAWCTGCGSCVPHCPFGLLEVAGGAVRLREETGPCLLCGYCAGACPDFCLKVV